MWSACQPHPSKPHLVGPQVAGRENDSPEFWQPSVRGDVPKRDTRCDVSVLLRHLKMASGHFRRRWQQPRKGLGEVVRGVV